MRRGWFALWLVVAAFGCSPDESPKVGGETHWLVWCADDSDCGDEGLSCVCGSCTRDCSDDGACADGRCYDTRSPVLADRCEKQQSSRAVCLAQCEADADCGDGRDCVRGACLASEPEPEPEPEPEVSWSEPLPDKPIHTTIEGATEAIVGTWTATNCDPAMPPQLTIWGCVTLVIKRAPGGGYEGHFNFTRNQEVLGPFAPATDPNVGYPTELQPSQYSNLANPQPTVDYRLLNGRMDARRVQFQWTMVDVWRDWCAMQKSYPWVIAGRTLHFCVPQDRAERAKHDFGKTVLCRSAEFEDYCDVPEGEGQAPCVCQGSGSSPMCSSTVCRCDSQGCGVQVGEAAAVEFSGDDRSAELVFGVSWDFDQRVALERISP